MPQEDHWLPGFNFNVQEWFDGDRYETVAICRTLALARAVFAAAIEEAREPVHDQGQDARGEAVSRAALRLHPELDLNQIAERAEVDDTQFMWDGETAGRANLPKRGKDAKHF